MVALIVLFGPITCIFIILIVTRKWVNPYKLFLVFGKKGSGKSTYLVKLAIKYLKKKWYVYTNMPDMTVPGVRLFDIEQLGDFIPVQHSLLLLDEVGMVWDNRNFKNFKPSVRDFFKLQRHYKVICYMASQTFDVDKKLRDLTDGMILNLNVLNVLSVGKTIRRHVTLTESTSEAESRIAEDLKFQPIWNWKFTWIPKYAKFFNSFEVPAMPELPYKEILCNDPKLIIEGKKKRKNKEKVYEKMKMG